MDTILIFYENNQRIKTFESKDITSLSIGRKDTNTIIFNSTRISREHAIIEKKDDKFFLTDLGSMNGTFINNNRIEKNIPHEIKFSDLIYFNNKNCKLEITKKESKIKKEDTVPKEEKNSTSNQKSFLKIGRGTDCDIKLEERTVSRNHATLRQLENGKFELIDLNSTNGTFYNGKRIKKIILESGEKFIIEKYEFDTSGNYSRLDGRTVVRMINVSKKYENKTVIHPLDLEIKPKSLTAIMGPSGSGKSTLLKMINGIVKNTTGSISVFDLDLDKYYDYFRNQIGYVPQDDIVHLELTVYQSIYYAAKLRLEHLDDSKIENKINHLLKQLKIDSIRNNLNSAISGGQRKRVCIAIELLSNPMLLLLDEPTSPLDPQSIGEFMEILKDLTQSGTTVILVTHKPDDLQFMDEVIFLTENGFLAYKGLIKNSQQFFEVESVVEIYSKLTGTKAKQWENKHSDSRISSSTAKGQVNKTEVNWVRQLYWLTSRAIKVKTNDSVNSWIIILQAPIIAGLIGFIFKDLTLAVLFMMVISSIWFGVNNAAREIVKERAIFRRENLFNVYASSYLFSKIITLSLIAVIQTFLFVLILNLIYSGADITLMSFGKSFFWLFVVNMASAMMGLMVSAAMKTSDKVLALVPIILIPQLMLAGVITKIHSGIIEFLSYFTFSRWGTEGMAFIQKEVAFQPFEGDIVRNDAIKTIQDNFHNSYSDFFDGGSLATDVFILCLMGTVLLITTYVFLKRIND